MKSSKKVSLLAVTNLVLSLVFGNISLGKVHADSGSNQVKLRIMETTDTHTNLFSYDYYKGAPNENIGMLKVASSVKKARAEVKNSVLVDNGDTIQGTPLGTYFAKVKPVSGDQVHPVIKTMNAMEYDIATLGNHEFNYGLEFMEKVYAKADFDFISANVYKADDADEPMFTPYKIVEKTVTDEGGNEQTLNIGYIGFVAPQIVQWDAAHLDGKAIAKDIPATAEKFVPLMKDEGADLIIAIVHSGFDQEAEAGTGAENVVNPLSKVKGIDAITFSHTHDLFPAPEGQKLGNLFKDKEGNVLPYIDEAKGTINGVPAVEAGYGGSHLGIIDLTLEKKENKWAVVDSQSSLRASANEEMDAEIAALIKADHDTTIAYTEGKLGTTTAPIYSYFALVQDDPSIQVVTDAQKWYVEKYIALNSPEYSDTPILSAGAPFKAGRNGPGEYTDIEKGNLTIRSAGDLYLYDNTLKAILIEGKDVRNWLDMSAGKFNQIDPNKSEVQELLNPDFPVFNFDVLDGVTYEFDVTKPAKYNSNGTINDEKSSRVVNLKYDGKPVTDNQKFIVITNNYRASGGGDFPGIAGSQYIVDSAEENRQILMDYISEKGEINPTADNNWSIVPINGDVRVSFLSSPAAEKYAALTDNITYTGKTDEKGFGVFEIDLSLSGTSSFSDVPSNHWAKEYIDSLASKGVIKGYPDGTFGPEKTVTRGQFIAMVVRSLGLSDGTLNNAEEIQIAYDKGITTRKVNEFEPFKTINREQMSAMITRAYNVKTGATYVAKSEANYHDRSKISSVFTSDVDAAAELGFMTGQTDGNFNPKGNAKRSHAAKVITLYLDATQ